MRRPAPVFTQLKTPHHHRGGGAQRPFVPPVTINLQKMLPEPVAEPRSPRLGVMRPLHPPKRLGSGRTGEMPRTRGRAEGPRASSPRAWSGGQQRAAWAPGPRRPAVSKTRVLGRGSGGDTRSPGGDTRSQALPPSAANLGRPHRQRRSHALALTRALPARLLAALVPGPGARPLSSLGTLKPSPRPPRVFYMKLLPRESRGCSLSAAFSEGLLTTSK